MKSCTNSQHPSAWYEVQWQDKGKGVNRKKLGMKREVKSKRCTGRQLQDFLKIIYTEPRDACLMINFSDQRKVT
jgi:hypothetical protein